MKRTELIIIPLPFDSIFSAKQFTSNGLLYLLIVLPKQIKSGEQPNQWVSVYTAAKWSTLMGDERKEKIQSSRPN